jgi:hypothetical protein
VKPFGCLRPVLTLVPFAHRYNKQHPLSVLLSYVDKTFARLESFQRVFWKCIFWNDLPAHGIRVYREHNTMVQRLAADRVLTYNTKEGWEPLCKFLELPVPDVEFPHVNKTAEHRAIFGTARRAVVLSLLKRFLSTGLLSIVAVWTLRRLSMHQSSFGNLSAKMAGAKIFGR